MTDFLAQYWLPASVAGGALTLCALLLAPLWRRLGARVARLLLVLACVCFLFPFGLLAPLVPLPNPLAGLPAFSSPANTTTSTENTGLGTAGQNKTTNTAPAPAKDNFPQIFGPQNTRDFTAGGWLAALYLSGLVAVATTGAVRYALLARALRRHRTRATNPKTLVLYHTLCAQRGRPPALYQCAGLRSPVLAGIAHPALYLPENEMTPQQAEFALRHELTHHRHRDIPLKLAALCLSALHWCNPLAWLLARAITENCEAYCDETVVRGLAGHQRHAYAATLLAFASKSRLPQPVSAFATPTHKLKRRMDTMLHPKQPTPALRALAGFVLCTVLCLGFLAGCATADAAQPEGQVAAKDSQRATPIVSSSTTVSTAAAKAKADDTAPATSQLQQVPAESPAAGPTVMEWPLPDATYISRMGGPGAENNHRGLDIDAENGSPIVAAAAGLVATAGWHYSYGNHVTITHDGGLITLYAHCQDLLVVEGQSVQAGEEIATVGSTGYTTGNVLHFEVQKKIGDLQNPMDYLTLPEDIPS